MQGVHAFDPKAKVSIDLESFVADDHFLVRPALPTKAQRY
jgi:hypothetical protein